MTHVFKKIIWWIFAALSIGIGLYPLTYFVIDRHFGLLSTKSQALLNDLLWNSGFYGHIIFGGLALAIGWIQFSQSFRNQNLHLHRTIGKTYTLAALVSGLCGIYIGCFATGGWISQTGFILLGIIWVATTTLAYRSIKNGKVRAHENYMLLSYAACFSAVTLRIWLPLLISLMKGEFILAYRIVAWISWMPNLLVALWIINRKNEKWMIEAGERMPAA